MSERVLITGATSDIGRRIVRRLSDSGLRLLALSRRPDESVEGAEMIYGDMTAIDTWRHCLDDVSQVVHLAGLTHSRDPREYNRINFEATSRLIEYCEAAEINRFILVSSRAVGMDGGAYSMSKFRAEQALKRSQLNWAIARPGEVYGLKKVEGIEKFVASVRDRGLVLVPSSKSKLAPVHVDDLVVALAKLVLRPELTCKTYTLCGPDAFTMREIAEIVAERYPRHRLWLRIPSWVMVMMAMVQRVIPLPGLFTPDQVKRLFLAKDENIQMARQDLAFEPRDFANMLARVGD